MRTSIWALTALIGCAAVATAQPAPDQFNQLWVFGDSLSDTGNVLNATTNVAFVTPRPTTPYYDSGRFTDGKPITGDGATILTQQTSYEGVWAEGLANLLNVPAIAPVTSGASANNTNYATGGAESGTGTFSLFSLPNVLQQIANYVAKPAAPVASKPLYAVWAGGNDLLDAATANGATPQTIATAETTAIANLQTGIGQLVAAGAKYVLWPDLPPLDKTPMAQTFAANLQTALGTASSKFATDEDTAIAALQKANAGLTIFKVDLYALFSAVEKNPAAYGITNTTQGVITYGSFSTAGFTATANFNFEVNPDAFVFWDQIHPTSRVHALIAQAAFDAIPEPDLAAGVIALVLIARRCRRA